MYDFSRQLDAKLYAAMSLRPFAAAFWLNTMSQILCIETSFYAARVVVIHLPAPCARFRGGCHIGDVLRTRRKRDNVTTGFLPSVPLHHQELSKQNSASPRTPQTEKRLMTKLPASAAQ
jgi:hypothetical protein